VDTRRRKEKAATSFQRKPDCITGGKGVVVLRSNKKRGRVLKGEREEGGGGPPSAPVEGKKGEKAEISAGLYREEKGSEGKKKNLLQNEEG